MSSRTYAIGFFLVLFSNLIVAILILGQNGQDYFEYDSWAIFSDQVSKWLLDPGHDIQIYFNSRVFDFHEYWHGLSPLWPFVVSLLFFIFDDLYLASVYVAGIASFISIFYVKKLCEDIFNLDDKRKYLTLSIYTSSYLVAHFMFVPLPVSLAGCFSVASAYHSFKFFKEPSNWNAIKLVALNVVMVFSRELLWPNIIFAMGFLLYLEFQSRLGKRPRALPFWRTFFQLAPSVIIPVVAYGIFFLSNNLFQALDTAQAKLIFYGIRTLPGLLEAMWLLIAHYWIFFALKIVQDITHAKSVVSRWQDRRATNHTHTDLDFRSLDSKDLPEPFKSHVYKHYLYMWFVSFILTRLILIGGWYANYFIPISFILAWLVGDGACVLESYLSHKIKRVEFVTWLFVAVAVLFNLLQLFHMEPFWGFFAPVVPE